MDKIIENLIHLQAADEQIAQITESIAALPRRIAALSTKLESQTQALSACEKQIKDEELHRRRLDSDLKDQQQKVVKYREQLNGVKTNEQFKALEHEVAFAEQQIRRLEDMEIESMERTDKLEAQRVQAARDLAEQAALVDQEKATATVATDTQQKELDALKAERAALRPKIDEATLRTYDRVSSGARKTGLARVQGQQCLGCQMSLRPQLWNQIRAGSMLVCESCGRLQYYDPTLEPVAIPKPETPKEKAAKKRAAKAAAESAAWQEEADAAGTQ